MKQNLRHHPDGDLMARTNGVRRWFHIFAMMIVILGVVCHPPLLSAQTAADVSSTSDTTDAELSHFEKHIRPALTKYCLECHATDTEANGSLLLDSRSGWQRGGDSGPAVVPGKPEDSRLMRAIRYSDPDLQMPPDGRLPSDVIAAFETWIVRGAVDPRVAKATRSAQADSERKADPRTWWSLQPLRVSPTPAHADTLKTAAIDGYISQRLASEGIVAAPQAARRDQVRRLYFGLTGLPPAAETVRQVEAAADFETAYRGLIDELLASPHYGETFARHWMDVARYGESVTLRGMVFREAWRYRDYLIRSYREDRPFDQMIREQIAGDLLTAADQDQRWMQLVATGFLAMGDTNFEKQDKQQLDMDYIDEQLDVLGQAFLGQTIACARCHDHKFDPIPTKDYYALAGILKSAVGMRHSNVSAWIDQPLPIPAEEEQQFAALETQVQQLTKDIAAKKKVLAAASKRATATQATTTTPGESGKTPTPPSKDPQLTSLEDEVRSLEATKLQVQEQLDRRPRYLTIVEELPPQNVAVHIRGDVHNTGDVVPRGFLTAIPLSQPPEIPEKSSGRLELAMWVSAADNPLTARVYVNRVWLWLMGRGLVDSVNNFGTTGSQPSHAQLLDWLAAELIRSGWSTKHLVRLIVTSDAYRRQVTDLDGTGRERDPDNTLYWRGHRHRLSAEALRDAMLQVSGELDTTTGGSLLKAGTKSDYDYQHASTRRSIYHPMLRNSPPELFDAFDFPVAAISTGQRVRSTVATQALVLLNHPWVLQRAGVLAERVQADCSNDEPTCWIRAAYQRCFQRDPSDEELHTCLEFFRPGDDRSAKEHLKQLAHSLLASIDFRYLD